MTLKFSLNVWEALRSNRCKPAEIGDLTIKNLLRWPALSQNLEGFSFRRELLLQSVTPPARVAASAFGWKAHLRDLHPPPERESGVLCCSGERRTWGASRTWRMENVQAADGNFWWKVDRCVFDSGRKCCLKILNVDVKNLKFGPTENHSRLQPSCAAPPGACELTRVLFMWGPNCWNKSQISSSSSSNSCSFWWMDWPIDTTPPL